VGKDRVVSDGTEAMLAHAPQQELPGARKFGCIRSISDKRILSPWVDFFCRFVIQFFWKFFLGNW